MGIAVVDLFAEAELKPTFALDWKQPCDIKACGVYVIALSPNPAETVGLALPDGLPQEAISLWLVDEPVVYIGKAGGPGIKSTLRSRLSQFYRHTWGARSPHRGGQDIHKIKHRLWTFVAETSDPRDAEMRMIAAFRQKTGRFPFANRKR